MVHVGYLTHFSHKNIITYSNRPFQSVEEMNGILIRNMNSVIKPDDILYHLGDWSVWYGKDFLQTAIDCRKAIFCKNIVLISGNHDFKIGQCPLFDALFSRRYDYFELKYQNILFCMMHYRLAVRNKGHIKGASIGLHGHGHPTSRELIDGSLDCGIDSNNYFPLTIDDVIKIVREQDSEEIIDPKFNV